MEFYFFLWFFFFFLSFAGLFGESRPPYGPMIIIILVLAVFVAFRVDVGSDWLSYKSFYYTGFAEDKTSGKMEPGFSLVRNVCYFWGLSHAVFFYLLSCMSMFAILKAAQLLEIPNIYIVFFVYISLFFCSFQFNIVRNGLVASFVWLAYAYKTNNMNIRAWIWIIIACSFHVVGVIFIIFMFFIGMNWPRKIIIILLASATVLFVLNFSTRLLSMFPILSAIDRLEGAIDADRTESYGLSLGMVFNISLFFYCYFIRHSEYEDNIVYRVLTNTMFISVVVGLTLNTFNLVVARIGQPLNMALLFMWPILLDEIENKYNKILVGLCLTAYLALYFYMPLLNDTTKDVSAMLVPYNMDLGQIFDTHF